jgi:hypothetical protein
MLVKSRIKFGNGNMTGFTNAKSKMFAEGGDLGNRKPSKPNVFGVDPNTALGEQLAQMDPATAKAFIRSRKTLEPGRGGEMRTFGEFEDEFNTPGFGQTFSQNKQLVDQYGTPEAYRNAVQDRAYQSLQNLSTIGGDEFAGGITQNDLNIVADDVTLGSTAANFQNRKVEARTPNTGRKKGGKFNIDAANQF